METSRPLTRWYDSSTRIDHEIPNEIEAKPFARLREQLWLALMVTNLTVFVISRIVRTIWGSYEAGESWISFLLLGSISALIIANIALRNTRHSKLLQGMYTLLLHLVTPVVLYLFGGTRGFGDISILVTVAVSVLYGFRRWMWVTFSVMGIVLAYILYLDGTGQPITPLVSYSSEFASLKFTISMFVFASAAWFGTRFYRSILDQYKAKTIELQHANVTMQANQTQLQLLTTDLQHSRRAIVSTREEERRRLRRDLHDGLGPTLAAQTFRIGAIRNNLHKDVAKADELLIGLEDVIETILGDVRRLVYALRPPLLDQLGLNGALMHFANSYETDCKITLDLPDSMLTFSAAVEVAIFRIVQTAVDNVLKHAQASTCTVKIVEADSVLTVSISDDGIGLPHDHLDGVGLTSMRERTDELGGVFRATNLEPHGTQIYAQIPLID